MYPPPQFVMWGVEVANRLLTAGLPEMRTVGFIYLFICLFIYLFVYLFRPFTGDEDGGIFFLKIPRCRTTGKSMVGFFCSRSKKGGLWNEVLVGFEEERGLGLREWGVVGV
jgi:hypothetical protein